MVLLIFFQLQALRIKALALTDHSSSHIIRSSFQQLSPFICQLRKIDKLNPMSVIDCKSCYFPGNYLSSCHKSEFKCIIQIL